MSEHSERIAKLIRQVSQRRDQEIKVMVLVDELGPSEIGRRLGVTRQRAQQLVKRIRAKKTRSA